MSINSTKSYATRPPKRYYYCDQHILSEPWHLNEMETLLEGRNHFNQVLFKTIPAPEVALEESEISSAAAAWATGVYLCSGRTVACHAHKRSHSNVFDIAPQAPPKWRENTGKAFRRLTGSLIGVSQIGSSHAPHASLSVWCHHLPLCTNVFEKHICFKNVQATNQWRGRSR